MFFPDKSAERPTQPLGSPNARIAIVGDYADKFDTRNLRPFSGPAGSVLEQCLHAAGLIRGECYITQAVKTYVAKEEDYYLPKKKQLTSKGLEARQALIEELDKTAANVIVACGDAPFAMLTDRAGVSKFRGYFFQSVGLKEPRKILPTHAPGDTIRGMYTYRHMISSDLKKARQESMTRALIRPERTLVYNYENITDAMDWLNWLYEQPIVACDIEVINFCTSCISFSARPDVANVIPFGSMWTEDEELQLWRGIQKVLGNPKSKKVFQNGIFDIQFLATQNGIVVRGEILDTMIGHSVAYPELPKGLGFLGSIYCGTQEYWKDAVKFDNIKDES